MDLNPAHLYPERRRRPTADEPPPPMPTRGRTSLRTKVLAVLLVLVVGTTLLPIALLRIIPAWTTSFMIQYQFERLFSERKMPSLQHDWVSWDDIAPAAKIAVIAAEDQKFPEHFGFDFEAIEKAQEHNQWSRRKRGASTISQQTAKNLFLWPGRSYLRKGLEAGYTVLLEAMWPKRRILEVYLNSAEFGEGIYGVEAASQAYFHHPASRLTYYEAALLAAVLPNPRRFKVAAPSGYVQSRASDIDGQMHHLGTDVIRGM